MSLADESGFQPDHIGGFLQGQQVSGFLPVSFASVGMFMAHTLGTVLAVGVFAHHAATECQQPQQDGHHQSDWGWPSQVV